MSDAQDFSTAAAALPLYDGVTWRAASFELVDPFTTETPIPTTRDVRVATRNFTVAGVHLIVSTAGRDVSPFSAHPSDGEVVLLPGARLVPVSPFHEVRGVTVQVVVEQPPIGGSIPIAPADADIAALIDEARAAAEIEVHAPGRFGA